MDIGGVLAVVGIIWIASKIFGKSKDSDKEDSGKSESSSSDQNPFIY